MASKVLEGVCLRTSGKSHRVDASISFSGMNHKHHIFINQGMQVVLETDCGVKLAFCDPRRFGKVRLQADPENNEPISKLGFDPILSMPDLATFSGMLAKQRRSVKPLLLDQSFSAGVGNWVADEILYQAKIHPEQKAASLDEAQCAALHHQMKVLPACLHM